MYRSARVRYDHDLDARETKHEVLPKPSAHEMAKRLQERPLANEELSPQSERLTCAGGKVSSPTLNQLG